MQHKLAAYIVRCRRWIFPLFLLLAVGCAMCIGRTKINYDLTRYLSEDSMTRRALAVMEEEFGSSEQLRVMFHDLDAGELEEAIASINAMPEVLLASHDPDSDIRQLDGKTYQLVSVALRDYDPGIVVQTLRSMFPDAGDYAVGGSAAMQLDLQESVASEIPSVMAIAVAVVLVVLFCTSHAWLEPPVILFTLAISILINMGTHFVFPDISFITFAVSAILQLALSIDYAVMLLHAFNTACDSGLSPEEAMTAALEQSFMRIASSAFTTVAGLLSLLFMSFSIGFDIGLALSKGILISMLTVFLFMPAVTLMVQKPLLRTRHRPLRLGGEHLGRFVYKARVPAAVCLVGMVAAGFVLQSGNRYSFTDAGRSTANTQSKAIDEVFGASSPLVLLVPGGEEDEDIVRQQALAEALLSIEVNGVRAVDQVSAMATTGAEAYRYYTLEEVVELSGLGEFSVRMFFHLNGFGESVRADKLLDAASSLAEGNDSIVALQETLASARTAFIGDTYTRMLLDMGILAQDEGIRPAIDAILAAAREFYGDDIYLTGVSMSGYDIGNAFESDLMRVNLITFFAILLIVAISFRSLPMPAILVFVIEGAIWITMGISRLAGQSIFFMSYLICVSIQMGATIDYGILLCDQYRILRTSGAPIQEAVPATMQRVLPTVLTSGVILITAGYIIGRRCTVYYISNIGLLLARGAAVSVVLVLTLLPALLALCDRAVIGRK